MDIGITGVIWLWSQIIVEEYLLSLLIPLFVMPILIWGRVDKKPIKNLWPFVTIGFAISYLVVFITCIIGFNLNLPLGVIIFSQAILTALTLWGISRNKSFIL